MRSKYVFALGLIVLLGGLLRFWRLGEFPVSLSMDEASVSYDAYSILKTGRDMYGRFLPLSFRSVGDYKSPVLVYTMVPAISIFGLNEFGTRATVSLIGSLSLVFVYLLARELTGNRLVSLLSALSVAIGPWHVHYSRATFDSVVADFFLMAGVYLLLKALRNGGKLLWLSAVSLSLSAYSYHAERLMVPLLLVGIVTLFRDDFYRIKKQAVLASVVGLVVSLPLFGVMLRYEGQARVSSVFIGQDVLVNPELKGEFPDASLVGRIFGNNLLVTFNFWLKRYLNYWDLRFLFLDGSKFTFPQTPDVGLFHLYEVIPFMVGLWCFFFAKSSLGRKERWVIVLWLLLGPLAASLTNNEQHAHRSLATIPAPQIIVGLGSYLIIKRLLKSGAAVRVVAGAIVWLVLFSSLLYFFDIYFVHFPVHFSEFWGYGRKETMLYAWKNRERYREIIVDPGYGTEGQTTIDAPYLYALYYSKYDPASFQKEPRRSQWKDSMNFANFTFRQIYWPKDCALGGRLFIGSPWNLPPKDIPQKHVVRTIFFKNNAVGFFVLENPERPVNCQAI